MQKAEKNIETISPGKNIEKYVEIVIIDETIPNKN